MHIVVEMSYCFLQVFFQTEILASVQSLRARDVDGWFFMVGKKVI